VMTDVEDQVTVYDLTGVRPPFILDPSSQGEARNRAVSVRDVTSPVGRPTVPSGAELGHRLSRDVKFSKDGRRIFATYLAGVGGMVWDVALRQKVESFTTGAPAIRLCLTGDGQRLAILTESQALMIWDTVTLKPTDFSPTRNFGYGTTFSGHIACNDRGNLLAYSSSSIRSTEAWDLDARHRIDSYAQGE